MAWIYLAESVGTHLGSESTLKQSHIVKTTSMLNLSCYHACQKECSSSHQFGMMSKPSKKKISNTKLILLSVGFHVKTSALLALEKAWKESEVDFSTKLSDLQMKLNRRLYSLKTYQALELKDFDKLSEHLPKWGMTVGGRIFLPQTLELIIKEKGGSSLPTPQARDYKDKGTEPSRLKRHSPSLSMKMRIWPTPNATRAGNNKGGAQGRVGKIRPTIWTVHNGFPNPQWIEWLMGFPYKTEWTALNVLGMQWFRCKQK